MKVLSIKQPWAAAILDGVKTTEIRTWKPNPALLPPGSRLAIHASKEVSYYTGTLPVDWLRKVKLVVGAVIGEVTFVEAVHYDSFEEFDEDCANHLNSVDIYIDGGLYGWVFEKPEWYASPIKMTGQLGLWDLDGPRRRK